MWFYKYWQSQYCAVKVHQSGSKSVPNLEPVPSVLTLKTQDQGLKENAATLASSLCWSRVKNGLC